MFLSFIHIVASVRIPSLFVVEQYSITCIHHVFLIHSSTEGHWGFSYFLAVVNNAVMNANVQVSVQVLSFDYFGYITRSGIAESYGNFMFSFLGTIILEWRYLEGGAASY